jgi:DNA-binding MarR family transcriptional regulator
MSLRAEDFEGLRLQNQLCFPLYAASRLIVQAYQPLLDALGGITYPQYLVLLVLWEQDGLSVKEISNKLYLDSGTITPVLKRLQDLGLIRRKRSEHDDRRVLNFLTTDGTELKPLALKKIVELFCSTGLTLEDTSKIKDSTNWLIEILLKDGASREKQESQG